MPNLDDLHESTRTAADPTSWAGAVCATADPEVFFPIAGGSSAKAKKICAGCPVRERCLEYALAQPADDCWGVWGGTTRDDRKAMRRADRAGVAVAA